MPVYIEALDGPQCGKQYEVKENVTLGRTNGEILIEDPKVSSTHAKFALNDKGNFVLVDLGSSNGLIINGRRVRKITLLPGVIFEIGNTRFKVFQSSDGLEINNPIKTKLGWKDVLRQKIGELIINYPVRPKSLQYPENILQLQFIQGPQNNDEILISYLPRRAGFGNTDINLKDAEVPKDAFELIKDNDGIRIRIFAPGIIKINDTTLANATLEAGDTISFGNTLIRIDFLKD